jgi:hypothetical protein
MPPRVPEPSAPKVSTTHGQSIDVALHDRGAGCAAKWARVTTWRMETPSDRWQSATVVARNGAKSTLAGCVPHAGGVAASRVALAFLARRVLEVSALQHVVATLVRALVGRRFLGTRFDHRRPTGGRSWIHSSASPGNRRARGHTVRRRRRRLSAGVGHEVPVGVRVALALPPEVRRCERPKSGTGCTPPRSCHRAGDPGPIPHCRSWDRRKSCANASRRCPNADPRAGLRVSGERSCPHPESVRSSCEWLAGTARR